MSENIKTSAIQLIEENENFAILNEKMDKYDYILASGCGVLGGLIDIFLVNMPNDSTLQVLSDAQAEKMVISFAKYSGWSPRIGNEDNIKSAIGFLERKFKVNYDQTTGIAGMNTKNHHFKSLSHSPSPIGLFFSILNQFTSTSSFISNGKLITIETDTFELQGGNFTAKLFCGICNWFGHIMSDISGSSGGKNRGTGVVAPFYELFGLCDFGSFSVGEHRKTLAEIADLAFQQGYDFRFAFAQSVPVVITNLCVGFVWLFREHFQYKKPLKELIKPSKKFRYMRLIANGTLCAIDVVDAGVRSGGNALTFFMRINLVGFATLSVLAVREITIILKVDNLIDGYTLAFKNANEILGEYIEVLDEITINNAEVFYNLTKQLAITQDKKELNNILQVFYQDMTKPYEEDFSKHMLNKNGTLNFKL